MWEHCNSLQMGARTRELVGASPEIKLIIGIELSQRGQCLGPPKPATTRCVQLLHAFQVKFKSYQCLRSLDSYIATMAAQSAPVDGTVSPGSFSPSQWQQMHQQWLHQQRQEKREKILGCSARHYSRYAAASCNPAIPSMTRPVDICMDCDDTASRQDSISIIRLLV